MISSQSRYEGIQSLLARCGSDGCMFLCLLSIAEEVNGKPIDLIDAIHNCMKRGWLTEDFTCYSIPILEYLTGKRWSRTKVITLTPIKKNEYTIAHYYNERTQLEHFRRRPYDTLTKSITVQEGHITYYYIYSIHPWQEAV